MAKKSHSNSSTSNRRLVIRIELENSGPSIWRRLEIAPELRLDQVHDVLQAAFEWDDAHLHEFQQRSAETSPSNGTGTFPFCSARSNVRTFNMQMDDDFGEPDSGEPESGITIGELLMEPEDELIYLFDFGDNWEHVLVMEESIEVVPNAFLARFVDGRPASPPEDCGGLGEYE